MKSLTNEKIPISISKLRIFSQKANATTINLGLGKPYIDFPIELKEQIQELTLKSKLDYSLNQGTIELREAIEARLKIKKEHQIITNGAQEALYLALASLINPLDEVLISDPGFVGYAPIVNILGGQVVFYDLKQENNHFNYDFDLIESKVSSKTKAIIIGDIANPTNSTFDLQFINKLLKLAEKFDFFVIVDEVYSELHYSKMYSPHSLISDRIISINSLSKSHALTGMRIGFLSSQHKDVIAKSLVLHQYMMTCANRLAQNLAQVIYQDQELYFKIIVHFRNYYKKNFEIFSSETKLNETLSEGGFYYFMKLPDLDDVNFCEQLLLNQNILITPGSFFGKQGQGFARIALSLTHDEVAKASKLLAQYLRK